MTSVGIGAHNATDAIILVEYDYGDNNSLLSKQTYANGDSITYEYDNLGRTTTETYRNAAEQIQRKLTYVYTGDGQLYSIHDSKTGYTYQYNYGALGTLLSSTVEDSNGNLILELRPLNVDDRDGGQQWKLGDTAYVESYVCNDTDGSVTAFYAADGSTISLGYDVLQRLVTASNGVYSKSYSYRDITDSRTTTQVSGLSYSGITDAPSYGYTYDVLGNLLTYTEDGITYTYTYDDQGQLTAAVAKDSNGNQVASYSYSYDDAGNILTSNGHNYGYSDGAWKDLLVSYDGHTISYDASGNPTTYYNGTAWSFTWTEGRKLATASGNGHNISYTYDANGLRTSKTVDNTEYRYVYNGGFLLRQTGDGKTLDFIYDNNGAPYALIYNNGSTTETYYYITNLQGDVMKLVDEDGATAASYSYDPYGNILTATGDMANINPLRYRGYYYDAESELYYLQSRYYDSTAGRWISPEPNLYFGEFDQGAKELAYNTYAYCANNPVNFVDYNGEFVISIFWAVVIGVVAGGAIGGVVGWGIAKYFNVPQENTWKYVIGGVAIGAFLGGCIGYLLAPGGGAVLWSGPGMGQAAADFARAHGLKVLDQTLRGKVLSILQKFVPYKVMRHLWEAASARFLLSYAGSQAYVHVFVTADNYHDLTTVFNSVEMAIIAELGLKIIWHFVQ